MNWLQQITAQFVDTIEADEDTLYAASVAVAPFFNKLFYDKLPIDEIALAIRRVNLYLMQENGIPWNELANRKTFTRKRGNMGLPLGIKVDNGYAEVSNAFVIFEWYETSPKKYRLLGGIQ